MCKCSRKINVGADDHIGPAVKCYVFAMGFGEYTGAYCRADVVIGPYDGCAINTNLTDRGVGCKDSLRDITGRLWYDSGEVIKMRDISKNIRTLRMKKKMTQDQLAELLCVTRQTVSNYETGKSRPDIDMLVRIADELGTDIHQVIYGVRTPGKKQELLRVLTGAAISLLLWVFWLVIIPIAREQQMTSYTMSVAATIYMLVRPLVFLAASWTVAQLVGMALQRRPLEKPWVRWVRIILLVLVIFWLVITVWYVGAWLVRDWMRIDWSYYEAHGLQPWEDPFVPIWVNRLGDYFMLYLGEYYYITMPLLGAVLWLFGFPKRRK